MLILGLVDVPWWGIVCIVIIAYLTWACREFTYFRKQSIAGPIPIPLFGNLHSYVIKSVPVMERECIKKYGDIGYFGEFFGSTPSLVVFDDAMLSEIMVKEFSVFTNRVTMKTWCPINDSMLVNLKDAQWKRVRNQMTPAFTTGKLKKMSAEINRCAKVLADSIREEADLSREIEMQEYAGGYAMDVIASIAFGIRVESQKDRNNEFVKHAKRAFNFINPLTMLVVLCPSLGDVLVKLGLNISVIATDVQRFFGSIVKQTLEMRKQETSKRSDFIGLMINAQRGENIDDDECKEEHPNGAPGITTDEILGNAMLFFIGGYDTTATSLSFFMYNMAQYPDIQERLMDEIKAGVGERDDIDLTLLQELPYLDQCVNENLRLFPPLMRSNRTVKQDITVNGVFLRKGIFVTIANYCVHLNPKYWPEPEKYDPDRFAPENRKNRNPYHFIPFGYGQRNCIGMRLALLELKVAIIHVLRKVKISTCDKTPFPMRFGRNPAILKAKNGIHLKVEARA